MLRSGSIILLQKCFQSKSVYVRFKKKNGISIRSIRKVNHISNILMNYIILKERANLKISRICRCHLAFFNLSHGIFSLNISLNLGH